MKTKTLILVAVAIFAVLVGGFVYVAMGDGDDRRLGAAVRSYVAGNWALEMNGAHAGYLKSVGGCGVAADAIGQANKHPGPPRYGPCRLQLPVNQTTVQWINDVLEGNGGRKSLALLQTDVANKVVARLDLANAMLTQFSLPALDAASKDQLTFTVEVVPESIQKGKGSGAAAPVATALKTMSAANFRLKIPGIDTSRVNKIDSWSFDVPIQETVVGSDKFNTAAAGAPRLSNVTVETAELAAPSFEAYLESFLIKGEVAAEKNGTIEFLSPDLKAVLFQIDLGGMGIIAGEFFGASESNADTVARRQFSFYVENAVLKLAK